MTVAHPGLRRSFPRPGCAIVVIQAQKGLSSWHPHLCSALGWEPAFPAVPNCALMTGSPFPSPGNRDGSDVGSERGTACDRGAASVAGIPPSQSIMSQLCGYVRGYDHVNVAMSVGVTTLDVANQPPPQCSGQVSPPEPIKGH